MKRLLFRMLPVAAAMLALIPVAQASAFEQVQQYGVGVPGSGNGAIGVAFGVAVAPDGTVFVDDIQSRRIAAFAQSGRFLFAAGKGVSASGGDICTVDCQAGGSGTGAGEINSSFGIAATADELFLTEGSRVSVYDDAGRFLRAFGADVGGPGVDVCTSVCGPGTQGFGAGQMFGASGVAIDRAGELLVAEQGGARIDVFDPQTGQFLRAFGKNVGGPGQNTCTSECFSGTNDGSGGSIGVPKGLAVSSSGEVFVTELGVQRVSVFTEGGEYIRSFGSEGVGAGQLKAEGGVVVSSDGTAYVADTHNNRLDVFGASGVFQRAFGLGVDPSAPDAAGSCTTSCQAGSSEFALGALYEPRGIAMDCRDAVYVAVSGRVVKYGAPDTPDAPCPPPPTPPTPPTPAVPSTAPVTPEPSVTVTAAKPGLKLRKKAVKVRAGKVAIVAIKLTNGGGTASGTVKVCGRLTRKAKKGLVAPKCVKVASVPAGGAATAKLRVKTRNTARGTYKLTVVASGSASASASVRLQVTAAKKRSQKKH